MGDDPRGIVLADLDGDGLADIATVNRGSDTVSVLIQDDDGSFDRLAGLALRNRRKEPSTIAAGRVDGNASIDLVVGNESRLGPALGGIDLRAAQRRDGLHQRQRLADRPSPSLSSTLVLADFDEDGALDIVSRDRLSA